MHHLRLKALEEIRTKIPVVNPEHTGKSLNDVYGESVFGDKELKAKLTPSTYEAFKKSMQNGSHLDPNTVDQIAGAMKEWALTKGATHFTHWFQPLHGLTAEKHDSFMSFKGSAYDRTLEVHFDGKQLIKGEPDASSFPHGGIRSTFEARGYTAWDMESPSFIRTGANGSFLCIPSAFASWTGESLDVKTPLLRSNEALSKATVRVLRLLGDTKTTSAHSNVGIEQEFFLIDRGFYLARPDLVACSRSLLGAQPSKGQQMEDHYFGSLERRVLAFMQDVEWRLWKLGVPTTTRHNEVAPSQYEMAPIFETVSVACDHNMLMMEVLKETAREHDFACLLHEKPFAGVNGSGKHNNYSVCTNLGENLMDPGHTPTKNMRFVLMLSAVVRAVSVYGDLMRASIAVPGNDFRLCANEAPPAIMSMYVGDLLLDVINQITSEEATHKLERQPSKLTLGVTSLPPLPKDASDRNRTSPFAFTGNKFEFRAVGSSQSCSRPAMVLNAIVADSLNYVADEIEREVREKGFQVEIAVNSVVKRVLKENLKIIFNGNGYSEEWRIEAEKRGLPNLRTTPEAIKAFATEKNAAMFERLGIMTQRESQSAQNILYENYSKTVAIEADCLHNMATSFVLPVALEYKTKINNAIDPKEPLQAELLSTLNTEINNLLAALKELKAAKEHAKSFHEDKLHEQSAYYRREVFDAMTKTRTACDSLEVLVDDKMWPFPKYSEMLFMK